MKDLLANPSYNLVATRSLVTRATAVGNKSVQQKTNPLYGRQLGYFPQLTLLAAV